MAADAHLNKESVRRYVNELLADGRIVTVEPRHSRSSALYAPAEPDDAPEFDLTHATVPAVQLGLGRDPLVAALFGARSAQGACA